MHPTITLTPLFDSTHQQRLVFESPADCVVGTTPGCHIRVPAEEDQDRPHLCILHFQPPMLQVEELAGPVDVAVNDIHLVTAPMGEPIGMHIERKSAEVELADGDELRIGSAGFKVHVEKDFDTAVPLYFV
jgi:hypothetical protein